MSKCTLSNRHNQLQKCEQTDEAEVVRKAIIDGRHPKQNKTQKKKMLPARNRRCKHGKWLTRSQENTAT